MKFLKNASGAGLPEAVILIGLVAVVSLGAVVATGDKVKTIFGNTNSSMSSSMEGHSVSPNPTPVDPTPTPPPPNNPPVWSSSLNVLPKIQADQSYSFDFSTLASDPDGDPLTFSLVSGTLPSGISFASSGLLAGSAPSTLPTSPISLMIQVSDGKGGTAIKQVSLSSGDLPYRYYRLEVLKSGGYANIQLADIRLKKTDNSYVPANMSSNSSGGVVVSASQYYSSEWYPMWYSFDASSSSAYVTPNYYTSGVARSVFIDIDLGSATKTNALKLISSSNEKLSFPTEFKLYGSNDSSFSSKRLLLSRSGEPSNTVFSMVKEYSFDSLDSHNSAPVWSGTDILRTTERFSFTHYVSASDPEGDFVEYSAVGDVPSGVSVSTSGVITGSFSSGGTYTLTVRATDVLGAYTDKTFTFEVGAVQAYQYYQLYIAAGWGNSNIQVHDWRLKGVDSVYYPQGNMTSNSSGGVVASSNYNNFSYEPWRAFDSDLSSRWVGFAMTGVYLNIDLGSPKEISGFRMITTNGANQAPRTFYIYGADNPSMTGKTLLFTSLNEIWPGSSLITREFNF